jgi:hypothetical protein
LKIGQSVIDSAQLKYSTAACPHWAGFLFYRRSLLTSIITREFSQSGMGILPCFPFLINPILYLKQEPNSIAVLRKLQIIIDATIPIQSIAINKQRVFLLLS